MHLYLDHLFVDLILTYILGIDPLECSKSHMKGDIVFIIWEFREEQRSEV